jgi:hypothetical protein
VQRRVMPSAHFPAMDQGGDVGPVWSLSRTIPAGPTCSVAHFGHTSPIAHGGSVPERAPALSTAGNSAASVSSRCEQRWRGEPSEVLGDSHERNQYHGHD